MDLLFKTPSLNRLTPLLSPPRPDVAGECYEPSRLAYTHPPGSRSNSPRKICFFFSLLLLLSREGKNGNCCCYFLFLVRESPLWKSLFLEITLLFLYSTLVVLVGGWVGFILMMDPSFFSRQAPVQNYIWKSGLSSLLPSSSDFFFPSFNSRAYCERVGGWSDYDSSRSPTQPAAAANASL